MTMPVLQILPAIDIKEGRAVRLFQGELAKESNYGLPVDVARDFAAEGASWIHLVDLDAAFGRGSNFDLIQEVISSVDINVELSGGIRDEESLKRALSTGCNRINLGTAAIENPEWTAKIIAQHGDRVAVGLDVRGHTLATRGWTEEGGDLFEMISKLDSAGCSRYIVTDVTKDGTLTGPNLELLREVCSATKAPVIASGGISVLQDLIELRGMTAVGIEGAIVGKAIYSGAFSLAQALDVAK
jgi:1-(5-phosphoribosyl)-5-[(5-phosphoribosylamino)methylideneamino] imidazole-4-carboxamide isomerase/N-(5'phosphoribosyl)anthranilate isomerase